MKYKKIKRIKKNSEQSDVYHLEVEKNHNFFANGLCVHNCYRGEIGLKLFNFSSNPYNIKTGDRVAQIAINFSLVDFGVEWGKVKNTDRGSGGFGSTGK
jgi:dUTPase